VGVGGRGVGVGGSGVGVGVELTIEQPVRKNTTSKGMVRNVLIDIRWLNCDIQKIIPKKNK
jgi:hypothetical protein